MNRVTIVKTLKNGDVVTAVTESESGVGQTLAEFKRLCDGVGISDFSDIEKSSAKKVVTKKTAAKKTAVEK